MKTVTLTSSDLTVLQEVRMEMQNRATKLRRDAERKYSDSKHVRSGGAYYGSRVTEADQAVAVLSKLLS